MFEWNPFPTAPLPAATGARKLAMYLGYGRGRRIEQEQRAQRGQWLDQKGGGLDGDVERLGIVEEGD